MKLLPKWAKLGYAAISGENERSYLGSSNVTWLQNKSVEEKASGLGARRP